MPDETDYNAEKRKKQRKTRILTQKKGDNPLMKKK